MAAVSELVTLYRIVFDLEPDEEMVTLLLRLEKVIGLSGDDPLERMLIVQMRVADVMGDRLERPLQRFTKEISVLRRANSDYWAVRDEISELLKEIRIARKGNPLLRIIRRHSFDFQPINVEVYNITFPIIDYLRYAFERRSQSSRPDYVMAARWSLFLVIGISSLLVFAGMGLERFRSHLVKTEPNVISRSQLG